MEKHRRKKHNAHKRALVIVNEHRPYLASTPGGTITVEKLDHAVADEAATVTDQESGRFELVAAVARVEKCRRWLQDSVKHFATVSTVVTPAGGTSTPFDGSRPPSDTQLIARVEAIHAAASADPDTFVKGGITPHGLDALAAELATFKTAKDTMTLKEASAYLAMDEATVTRMAAERVIPSMEVEGGWVFSKKSIDKWRRIREKGGK